jgi:hypothetical protein
VPPLTAVVRHMRIYMEKIAGILEKNTGLKQLIFQAAKI